jgi:hypothetical protein
MIVKIFKISTKEMYTFRNKYALHNFVQTSTNRHPSLRSSINELVKYLPVEDYYRVR